MSATFCCRSLFQDTLVRWLSQIIRAIQLDGATRCGLMSRIKVRPARRTGVMTRDRLFLFQLSEWQRDQVGAIMVRHGSCLRDRPIRCSSLCRLLSFPTLVQLPSSISAQKFPKCGKSFGFCCGILSLTKLGDPYGGFSAEI